MSALWVVHTSFITIPIAHDARYFAGFEQPTTSHVPRLTGSKYSSALLVVIENAQVAGENTQSKGKIRKSLVLDAFPRQPQSEQVIFSLPNTFIASVSESDELGHFR